MEVIGKLSDTDRCFCVSCRNEVMETGNREVGKCREGFWYGICTAAGKF